MATTYKQQEEAAYALKAAIEELVEGWVQSDPHMEPRVLAFVYAALSSELIFAQEDPEASFGELMRHHQEWFAQAMAKRRSSC